MINEHYIPEAVILANGEYPTHPLPLRMLEEAKFVVCCDGAANEYISRGHTPDVIIGDGDSLSPEYKELFAPIIHRIADQETNDQTKAVLFLQKKGYRKIAIVGATGKREDHTLGNIQSAHRLYERESGNQDYHRLRCIYARQRYTDIRVASRSASFHYQFRSKRIERRRIGLSSQ